MDIQPSSFRSILESLPPRLAFTTGIILTVLSIGTIGFVVLGGCLITGKCTGISIAQTPAADNTLVADNTEPVVDTTTVPEPEPTSLPAVTANEHISGNKNAAVTMILYTDLECPFCGSFHPTFKQAVAEYKNKVRFVVRHYPLSFHPQAEPAAEASECASEQGKFWEYIDKIFADQGSLSADFLKKIAGELKMDLSKFQSCLDSDKYLSLIRTQASGGGAAGVSGTPAPFIITKDGSVTPIRGAQPYSVVKQAIDAALTK